MPTGRDRVGQQAGTRGLEPIFAANFQDPSDGFRPKRRAHHAVQAVTQARLPGGWGVEADLPHDFDPIAHTLLRRLVARRIRARRVVQLLRQWLTAGVLEQGHGQPTEVGSPHGGVVSPLRANIYWPALDMDWVTCYAGLGERFRSAADRVIICRTQRQAAHAFHAVRLILQKLKRQRPPTKTRLVGMAEDGFAFLGVPFHKRRAKRTGTLLPDRWPSQKAMQARRGAIHGRTRRPRWAEGLAAVRRQLNPVMAGWRHSFPMGNRPLKLPQLDRDVWRRVRRLVRAKRGSRGHWQEEGFAAWLKGRGLAGV